MKFLIWGAGGIGAYYGARLQQAGHAAVLVARGEHLQALQRQGLRVQHESLKFHAPVRAVSAIELKQQYQANDFSAILITLKATATETLLEEAGDWLNDGSIPVISLQNGVDNERLIADCIDPQRVVGGLAVRIGGHIIAPGTIEARGPAQIIMGAWPNAERNPALSKKLADLGQLFNQAGIPTTVSPDIQYELWRKLLINNGVNPLSALTRLDTRKLTHHPEFGPIVYGLMQETAQAAQIDGVPLRSQDVDEMFELIRTFDAIKTSMLVDLEMGRPLEIDAICGAVIERIRRAEKAAPYTELIKALLSQDRK